ncbi:MAG: CehA/McbA family metallohydrolase [Pirellulales bacterium]
MHFARSRPLVLLAAIAAMFLSPPCYAAGNEQLTIKVTDRDTGKPLAVRMHLKNAKGVAVKPPKVPFWKDHFVFDGEITLKLPRGNYTFEMERGPEYLDRSGYFTIEPFANDTKEIDMKRFVDMAKSGWYAGDLHVHRPLDEIELLMRAEDLHVAPVITWWNAKNTWTGKTPPENRLVNFDGNRFYHVMAGEDERKGGALMFFNLDEPLDVAAAKPEYPSAMKYLLAAKEHPSAHVDAEKPFWWDFPVWLASGKLDSVGLANNHLHRSGVMDNEAWGKPRDRTLFPAPRGNGRWSQEIYYHVLNCGIKLPPSAGSASGVLPNPVGYNRVYVHVDGDLTWDKWFEGLRAGRVVVTNGPLIIPNVEGKLPGHTFQADAGETVELEVGLTMATREKVEYLEVVQNGRVTSEVRLDDWKKAGGKLPPVRFDHSGWFLIRAVTNAKNTYRFASTGPYYVQVGYEKRISHASAQFFLDWVRERMKQIELPDAAEQREVLQFHQAAEAYWQKLVDEANAE